ncbi:unnamed protein product [Heterobilharzia americana]|nr:unnamed protein product [Heterobilharzia americana]
MMSEWMVRGCANSFAVRVCKLWNSLPLVVVAVPSPDTFKRGFEAHLVSFGDDGGVFEKPVIYRPAGAIQP